MKSEFNYRKQELRTDSAYGSVPTDKNLLTSFAPSQWYGSLPNMPSNDQWRFEIYPQDLYMEQNSQIFKPHVKELLTGSFEDELFSPISCSPQEIFSNGLANFKIDTEMHNNHFSDFEDDNETIFPMSPTTETEYKEPKHSRDGKCFPCTMCSSTFSRNHDLKRHVRIHLGIRPFKCESCPKAFTRLDALHRHTTVRGCKGMK